MGHYDAQYERDNDIELARRRKEVAAQIPEIVRHLEEAHICLCRSRHVKHSSVLSTNIEVMIATLRGQLYTQSEDREKEK